ncbi:recombinase family protein [Janthinobacterium sp. BJB303]|nr:recombinase family protein [Janthinobacterium sp. BJB303]
MPIAYSYVRFSTAEQKRGDSLRRQLELSEKYAIENSLTLDNNFHLHDLGFSAFDRSNIDRGALGGFLEAIKQHRIAPGSYLLVESLDRLSRDKVLAALEIFISILSHGITIVTLADRMIYSSESVGSNFGNLIISITVMARAHEESVTKSRRILAAWEAKRSNIDRKKLTAQCPRWLKLNEGKTEFLFVPERAALVIEILSWHKAGLGQSVIAKMLNQRGEKPFGHGKGWHSSYVQKIINSVALYGEFQPRIWNRGENSAEGEAIQNYFPALITKEEFNLLKNSRSERRFPGARAKKSTDIPNLLSGIVKCGYCGSTMILTTTSAKRMCLEDGGGVIRPSKKVLVCDGARRGVGCYAVQWDYVAVEKSFLSFCSSIDLPVLLNDSQMAGIDKKREMNLAERLISSNVSIIDYESRLEKLLSALETAQSSDAITRRIKEIEVKLYGISSEKIILEREIASIATKNHDISGRAESIQQAIESLESLTGEQRLITRSMISDNIRNLIEAVNLYPAGRLIAPERLASLRAELLANGWEEGRVDEYLANTHRTKPLRTGRGIRGRYASRADIGRFFVIKARNGSTRVVFPDFEDPSKVLVTLGDA